MKTPTVRPMLSTRTNEPVRNQYIIDTPDNYTVFQSYKTKIAMRGNGVCILDTNALSYSRTTSKYLYQFLGMSRDVIEKCIDNKTILVKDLNN